MHRNAVRLLRLVNMLLDFSRIEVGRIHALYEPTDLAALTIDLASTFGSAVERGGLRLEIDCPPLSEPVYVDRDMWEKIVLNLLSNAFKFTHQGSNGASRRSPRDAELSIADTGIGIEAGELPHMFERFHRVRNAKGRTFEGTGIGLALVKELIMLHGGDVSVKSLPGRGTTFNVRLPLGTAHLPADHIGTGQSLEPVGTAAAPLVVEASSWLPNGSDLRGAADQTATDVPRTAELPGETCAEKRSRPHVLLADDNADMLDMSGACWRTFTTSRRCVTEKPHWRRHWPPLLTLCFPT